MLPVLPDDVRQWLISVFGSCNQHAAGQLSLVPTMHEPALDMALISHLGTFTGPTSFPSAWVVRIDAMYEGGRRHWGSWEVADIGVVVTFRRRGAAPIQKLALLQSKRLYPIEASGSIAVDHDQFYAVYRAFNEVEDQARFDVPRTFVTSNSSEYEALVKDDNQYLTIRSYETDTEIPVYYLLYNPLMLPNTVVLPRMGGTPVGGRCEVGCRVVPAVDVRTAMETLPAGAAPRYDLLASHLAAPFDLPENRAGWPIERFLVDVVLRCEGGYLRKSADDLSFLRAVSLRGAPIASAIALTFDVPGEGPWGEG